MDLTLECKICGDLVAESDKKHYWSKHKLSMADYFITYYKKRDLLTNETISFKSLEQYLNTDFANKNNFKKWLKQQPKNTQKEYCEKLLKNRIKQKNLIYAPTQTELRTLSNFPSIVTFNSLFGDYYQYCESLGLKNKYKNIQFGNFEDKNLEIIVDTRESSPLKFDSFTVKKLDYGDYTAQNSKIFIERKSLSDLLGTLSSGFERFDREIERCAADNNSLIVLCESNINDFLGFNYLPHIKRVTKVTPEFIGHRIRKLLHKYPETIQFAFCDGRPEMARIIQVILGNNDLFCNLEVQLLIDLKII